MQPDGSAADFDPLNWFSHQNEFQGPATPHE